MAGLGGSSINFRIADRLETDSNALFLSLGYGLWRLRNWARQMQIVLSMIGAVGCLLLTINSLLRNGFDSGILFLGLGFAVPNVVIILYLVRPQVKQAFGGPEVQKTLVLGLAALLILAVIGMAFILYVALK